MIQGNNGLYEIGDKVASAGRYQLHLCLQEQTGRQCLLQIATAVENNGDLERAAYLLQELGRRAAILEEEYGRVKQDPNDLLNYGLGFPELVDGFVCQEQGRRRINILAFREVENVSQMVPLINITAKDRLRVDLRTSAWIMGKLLKLLSFAHGEKTSVSLVSGNNILIEPNEHYTLIFDWSAARIYSSDIPREQRRQEIACAAKAVIVALGGNMETETFPNDEESSAQYTEHLLQLASGSESNAGKAHEKFYELIDSLWERAYHPFMTKPL